MIEKYYEFVCQNIDFQPVFELIDMTQKQNSFQYVGGQIFQNSLYSVVNSSEKMLKYNLTDGSTEPSMEFLGEFGKRDFKWTGGCVYQNRFYAFPRAEDAMLVFDPETETFEKMSSGFAYTAEHHYGGVCTGDGVIYQPPRNTDHILKWDLRNKTCSKIVIEEGGDFRYCGSVIHPNGFVYFIPERELPVLKMEIKTEQIVAIGQPVYAEVFDPTLAADGNIYGFSSNKGLIKIDTGADRVEMLHSECACKAYGTKPGINGKLYSLPGYTNEAWEFNPFTAELRKCFSTEKEEMVHYAGGAVDRNGDIYGLPVHADTLLRIRFRHPDEERQVKIPSPVYDLFYKDFY